jgi:hypothetical protein
MTVDREPLPPLRLGPLDRATLEHLATAVDDCVGALSAGERVRGMDPLVVLSTLAELLRTAALPA